MPLIYLIGPYTFLGRLFGRGLTNSKVGVVIAMTFVAAPFLIVAATRLFERANRYARGTPVTVISANDMVAQLNDTHNAAKSPGT